MLGQDPMWGKRVRAIEIHLSHSPCPSCTGLLVNLRQKLANDQLGVCILQWTELYESPSYPTMRSDVRRLRGSYTVVGPEPPA
jgi:hypothetical protein